MFAGRAAVERGVLSVPTFPMVGFPTSPKGSVFCRDRRNPESQGVQGRSSVPLTAPRALVLELLMWLAARPRRYDETMEAWRTSCPRMPVWEDATTNDLVIVVASDEGNREPTVCLTAKGQALLKEYDT